MDARSFDLVTKRPHRVILLSPQTVAEKRLLAKLASLDNSAVECNNAAIRRRCKKHVQTTGPDMVDVSAEWVHKWSRSKRGGPFGDDGDAMQAFCE